MFEPCNTCVMLERSQVQHCGRVTELRKLSLVTSDCSLSDKASAVARRCIAENAQTHTVESDILNVPVAFVFVLAM